MLANRDEEGRFMTWVLREDEPNVVSTFRIEADPVVNANVIAYLGDHRRPRMPSAGWKLSLPKAMSKARPSGIPTRSQPTMRHHAPWCARGGPEATAAAPCGSHPGTRDDRGGFGNVLQTAQAVSALYNVGRLDSIDAKRQVEGLLSSQHDDGSWPELLAFGDQTLKWGTVGQIGHGSKP